MRKLLFITTFLFATSAFAWSNNSVLDEINRKQEEILRLQEEQTQMMRNEEMEREKERRRERRERILNGQY